MINSEQLSILLHIFSSSNSVWFYWNCLAEATLKDTYMILWRTRDIKTKRSLVKALKSTKRYVYDFVENS